MVKDVFSSVAHNYDVMNDLMSAGKLLLSLHELCSLAIEDIEYYKDIGQAGQSHGNVDIFVPNTTQFLSYSITRKVPASSA